MVECVFRVSSPPPLRSSKSAITRNHAVTIFTFALTSWAGWRSREKFARAPQRHATLLKHNRVFVCVCGCICVFRVCCVYNRRTICWQENRSRYHHCGCVDDRTKTYNNVLVKLVISCMRLTICEWRTKRTKYIPFILVPSVDHVLDNNT